MPKTHRRSRVSDGLLQGLKEAVAYSHGELKARTHSIEIPGPAPKWSPSQVRNLRKERFGLSQPLFAAILNVATSTVRAWEQGQKTPSGAAARLLQLFAADLEALKKLAV